MSYSFTKECHLAFFVKGNHARKFGKLDFLDFLSFKYSDVKESRKNTADFFYRSQVTVIIVYYKQAKQGLLALTPH